MSYIDRNPVLNNYGELVVALTGVPLLTAACITITAALTKEYLRSRKTGGQPPARHHAAGQLITTTELRHQPHPTGQRSGTTRHPAEHSRDTPTTQQVLDTPTCRTP